MDDYEDTIAQAEGTPLERAIYQWSHGYSIPLDLATELLADGYDLNRLEAKYRA